MAKEDLDAFISWLNEKKMPVFANTVSSLARLTAKDESSNVELVQVILKDASMTAQVLKVANSPYYNFSPRKTTTVSRAVMLIGFEAVRSICLSIKAIDYFLKGVQREQLVREMARAFHAAVQAKAFALSRTDESPEEIFVATLLYRLGDIAFWCFCPNDLAEQLEYAVQKPGYTRSNAEMEVLGFRLKELTARLTHEWRLGELLQSALGGNPGFNPRVRCILLATEFARSVEDGWDTPKFKRLIKEITELVKLPPERVQEMVRSNAKTAVQTAVSCGADQAGRLIPLPPEEEEKRSGQGGMDLGDEQEGGSIQIPDPTLQLQILRELSAILAEGQQNPKLLLSMVLEGILRGVGMDRIFFAALTPDGQHLRVNHVLGWVPKRSIQEFALIPVLSEYNIFSHALKTKQALWLKPNPPAAVSQFLTKDVSVIIGDPPFYIAPVLANNQPVGVIYSDRKVSKRELDEEGFSSFKHFCYQANLSLSRFP